MNTEKECGANVRSNDQLGGNVIAAKCKCGELVFVETGRFGLCRKDGKRPFQNGDAENCTRFRCERCGGFISDTCHAAAFDA